MWNGTEHIHTYLVAAVHSKTCSAALMQVHGIRYMYLARMDPGTGSGREEKGVESRRSSSLVAAWPTDKLQTF